MKIFSGSSNKPLAEKIAKQLNLKVSPLEIFIFPDGERRIRVLEKVLGQDTVVVQTTSNPPDRNYMELFFIIDALKRSGAKSVTAVVPYLGYQRQDHVFRDGEAVSLEVIVRTLESTGLDRVIVVDLHSIKIPELFHIPVVHVSVLPIFAEKITEICKGNMQKCVLVSPDMGGIRRIKILSKLLNNIQYAIVEKNRDLAVGKVSAKKMQGNVKGKTAIIVDDMISSGGTMVTASNLLLKEGAKEILVFATHPVLSHEAPQILQNSPIKKICVTDSINVPRKKLFEKLEIISIAPSLKRELY